MSKNIGTLSVAARGFGFIMRENAEGLEESFFVVDTTVATFLPGDVVSFDIVPGRKAGQFTAENVKLVSRAEKLMLGKVTHEFGQAVLVPDEYCFCKIQLENVHHIAKDMVVAVRIPAIDEHAAKRFVPKKFTNGKLERVLGIAGAGTFEVDYALARQDFSMYFPTSVHREVIKLGDTVVVDKSAKDLTHVPFVTVDGSSTKDFDDAVYVEKHPDGWKVMVAIADVAHYVRPGTELDKEAAKRSTSVYMGHRVIPMLPEVLSTGLCSLMPNVVRRALVAEMVVDAQGNIITSKSPAIYAAFIKSAARITYDELTGFIETGSPSWNTAVNASLTEQYALYKVMLEYQVFQAMEFEDPEPHLFINDEGQQDIEWSYRTVAHKVVEQLMLLANRYAAKQASVLVQRYQAPPETEKWEKLVEWLNQKGITLEEPMVPTLTTIKAILAAVDKRTDAKELRPQVEFHIRRNLTRAEYVVDQQGHFSLGYEAYTHFTSPIRRYADLMVHRQLMTTPSKGWEQVTYAKTVENQVKVCSERSNAARLAERDVWDRIKKRVLFRKYQGQELKAQLVASNTRGVLLSVLEWQTSVGLNVELLENLGYKYQQDTFTWVNEDSSMPKLELGTLHVIRPLHISEDRPRVEITAELVQ